MKIKRRQIIISMLALIALIVTAFAAVFLCAGTQIAEAATVGVVDSGSIATGFTETTTHTPSASWSYDDKEHWHECTDCGAHVNGAAHSFMNEICTVCSAKQNYYWWVDGGTLHISNADGSSGGVPGGRFSYDQSFTTANVPWADGLTAIERVEVTGGIKPLYANNWFNGMTSLTYADLSGLTYTSSMFGLFWGCTNLAGTVAQDGTAVRLGNSIKINSGMNMSYAFNGCSKITGVDFSSISTGRYFYLQSAMNTFGGCTALTSVNFGEAFQNNNYGGKTSFVGMFMGCAKLQSVDLSKFDFGKEAATAGVGAMFQNCCDLESVTFGETFNEGNISDTSNMFKGCTSLKTLDLTDFNTAKVTAASDMFTGCVNLTTVTAPATVKEGVSIALPAAGCCWTAKVGEGEAAAMAADEITSAQSGALLSRVDGHGYGDWTTNDTQHYHHCTVCGDDVDRGNHGGGTATCQRKATCEVCGAEYGGSGEHAFGEWIASVPATQTQTGTKAHKDCSVCGKHFDESGAEIADLVIPVLPATGGDEPTAPVKVTVTVSGGTFDGKEGSSVEVDKNGAVTVVAENRQGRIFKGWSADGGKTIISEEARYSFSAEDSMELVAVYEDAGLGGGAIAGITIGCILLLLVAVYVVGLVLYKKDVINRKLCGVLYFYINKD